MGWISSTSGKRRLIHSLMKMNAGVLLGASLFLSHPAEACNTGCKAPELIIEPGRRAGPITKDTSEAQLKASLRPGEVVRLMVHIEEDVYQCGSAIFPGSLEMAFITWGSMDKVYRGMTQEDVKECLGMPNPTGPQNVIIQRDLRREPNQPTAWRSTKGIRLGMDLKGLEAAAGKPFEFSVCPCDAAGFVFGMPRQDIFKGLDLWLDIPDSLEHVEKNIKAVEDYALSSSNVPPDLARKIRLRKIVVHLND